MTYRQPSNLTVRCTEYIEIGPFRFECDGHFPRAREQAIERHGGKMTHHATSPGDIGDVDVTFWTMVEEDPQSGRSRP